jgi:hypothetical protein
MRDADHMLCRVRTSRVRDRFCPARREYLHRACCDVSDLLDEVKGWLTRWPDAMAALAIAAEGAHLHPDILEFSYSRELPKMVSALFSFEAIRGSGLGRLAEFRQDGEWCSREEAAELLLPIEREAREMVRALLEALPRSLDRFYIYLYCLFGVFILFIAFVLLLIARLSCCLLPVRIYYQCLVPLSASYFAPYV